MTKRPKNVGIDNDVVDKLASKVQNPHSEGKIEIHKAFCTHRIKFNKYIYICRLGQNKFTYTLT